MFERAFKQTRQIFPGKSKRALLKDLEGQIEEDEEVQIILQKTKPNLVYLAVTFDRNRNDAVFSYSDFDALLVMLDAIAGGTGIYKPNNQMRALRWNSRRSDLLRVLRFFARHNAQLRFRRALVLPFPKPIIGYRVDGAVHKK